MPTTSKLALPYPAATDPADVPLDMQELADAIAANAHGHGTSLPASPVDGQEYVLVDSLTNPSYQWRLRYNAGSTSSYKWEFVGGAEAAVVVFTAETTTTLGSWVNVATVGPAFTVPRAGDYLLAFGAFLSKTAADIQVGVGVGIGDFASPDAQAFISSYAANASLTPYGSRRRDALAASSALRLKYYQSTAGTLTVQNRWLFVKPMRVS
jgi:hypothetical protein